MTRTVELLARAREEAGLTQRALAAAADIPQASVSRVETGLISPRASTVERWLAACSMRLVIEPVPAPARPRGVLEGQPDAPDWAPWLS